MIIDTLYQLILLITTDIKHFCIDSINVLIKLFNFRIYFKMIKSLIGIYHGVSVSERPNEFVMPEIVKVFNTSYF